MRLDHVLLAVRDLESTVHSFRGRLGMNALAGGVHPGRGTHNALVHFGTAYLELISVNEPTAPRARELSQFMADGDAPYTWAMAVDDLGAALASLRDRGLEVEPPREGSRRTPDGRTLRWRSAGLSMGAREPELGSVPLPFLIEWRRDAAGDAWFDERFGLARHEACWGALRGMLVATDRSETLAREYETLLGWRVSTSSADRIEMETVGGDAVNSRLGPAPRIVLVAPAAPRDDDASADSTRVAAAARLSRHGPGVFGLTLEVDGVDGTGAVLARRGVYVQADADGDHAILHPRDSHGLLLELREARQGEAR